MNKGKAGIRIYTNEHQKLKEKIGVKIFTDEHRKLILNVEELKKTLKPSREVWNGDLNQTPADGIGWKFYDAIHYATIIAKNRINILPMIPATKYGHFRKNQITVVAETNFKCSDLGSFETDGVVQFAVVQIKDLKELKYIYDLKLNEIGITKEDCDRNNVAMLTVIEKMNNQKPLMNMQEILDSARKKEI